MSPSLPWPVNIDSTTSRCPSTVAQLFIGTKNENGTRNKSLVLAVIEKYFPHLSHIERKSDKCYYRFVSLLLDYVLVGSIVDVL